MKKLLWLVVITVAVVVMIAAYRSWKRETIATSQVAMLDAELAYVTQLRDGLERLKTGDTDRAVTVILAPSNINRMLEGLNEARMEIGSANAVAEVKEVSATFRDGFPEIELKAEITAQELPAKLGIRILATLEPRFLAGPPSELELFVRPLEVQPTLQGGGISVDSNTAGARLLAAVLGRTAEALPRMSIPLSTTLDVSFPGSTQPVSVPTQSGALNGFVDLPSFSSKVSIFVRQMYFLSDGLHVVAAADERVPELLPYKLTPSAPIPASQRERAVNEKLSAVRAAREAIAPVVEALKVADADLTVDVASQVLNGLLTAVNSQPVERRTVRYRTVSEDGQLFRAGGGGLGCGGYAELVGHNSATVDVIVSNVLTSFGDNGIQASAHLAMKFAGQVTGHVHGPAGPRTRMETRCIGGGWSKICADVPVVTVSCDSPVGGGVGLGNYGISADREETVTARVTFRSDAESWLHYDVDIVSPAQVPITVEVGLGQLGNLGLPFTFSVPQARVATGAAPPLIGARGLLNAPSMLPKPRVYEVAVQPTSGELSTRGYRAKATMGVTWVTGQ